MSTSANPSKHISIPKTFLSGDVDEWFRSRFEICCKANDWSGATKAAKLPTLLEGEALAVWLELSEEDKDDYSKAKKAIKSKLLPTAFSALDKFNRRSMLPVSQGCVSQFPGYRVSRTHIPRDACFPAHISLGIRVSH